MTRPEALRILEVDVPKVGRQSEQITGWRLLEKGELVYPGCVGWYSLKEYWHVLPEGQHGYADNWHISLCPDPEGRFDKEGHKQNLAEFWKAFRVYCQPLSGPFWRILQPGESTNQLFVRRCRLLDKDHRDKPPVVVGSELEFTGSNETYDVQDEYLQSQSAFLVYLVPDYACVPTILRGTQLEHSYWQVLEKGGTHDEALTTCLSCPTIVFCLPAFFQKGPK